jgi:four helix bundle protein
MATINKFEDLEIWQLSRKLYNRLSPVIETLKIKREYRFAEQMRSASGSIMDNIAKGFERSSKLEFVNSLGISKGELGELKSQLYRCIDNNFINQAEFEAIYTEADILSRKIASFIIYLNSTVHKGLKFKDRLKS